VFVKQWWATKFAMGVSDNEMYYGYINRIDTWIDTLQNHVLSELEGSYALQEWYSSLLNNYFTELLNNAEKYANESIQDIAQRQYLLNSVQNGRDLIERFNGVWDVRPDDNYSGPSISPEVDKINRMPVAWNDL
jgi:hypothetical protein